MIVFSSGPYEDRLIEDIVDEDPAFILWAKENHPDRANISNSQLADARRMLDEWNEDQIDPYDDFDYALSQATALGYVPGADNDG
jgi:hypothetical protein